MLSRPIWWAESVCGLHLLIGLLVVELKGKMFNIPPGWSFLSSVINKIHLQATMKKFIKMVSRPIWRAKFVSAIHLLIRLLVVKLEAKMFQIPPAKSLPQTSSWVTTACILLNYNRKSLKTVSMTHLTSWICQWYPFVGRTLDCKAAKFPPQTGSWVTTACIPVNYNQKSIKMVSRSMLWTESSCGLHLSIA